ncbi:beta-ketoacyl-ACP synthase II, partial [Psychromonas sp.]|nr:beta-ketoacyl-ACP synthase II [Psychromonas sp.]
MSKRRVVITGLGMLCPVGNTVEQSWNAVRAGQSGISNIEHFDTEKFSTKFAGLIKDFDVEQYMPKKEARKMDLFIQYGVAAAEQAFQDSGLVVTDENADRIGVAIGSGIGGLGVIEQNKESFDKSGPRKISPFFVPATI